MLVKILSNRLKVGSLNWAIFATMFQKKKHYLMSSLEAENNLEFDGSYCQGNI